MSSLFPKEKVSFPEKTIKFDSKLETLYSQYIVLCPLNINSKNKDLAYWRKNNIFSIADFSRLIKSLIESKSIDEFIKVSMSDFDNLAMIINVAVKNKVISINKKGYIKDLKLFNTTNVFPKTRVNFVPNNQYNQFPCDDTSRFRRAQFLFERYPFVEHLKFAIIGEDDFISPLFVKLPHFQPIILEKDEKIIKKLKSYNKDSIIYALDIRKDKDFEKQHIPSVQTFITDPPYTLHGTLAFIYRGLSVLSTDRDTKEFYVILNPAMMGENLTKIKEILSKSNVYLHEVINNFSQYKLPKSYQEYKRAHTFLNNININAYFVKYSSSSSLYIFRTTKPKTTKLRSYIDFKKIYQHYL